MTLAITNYNRTDLLMESFMSLTTPRITEIVISDDHSKEHLYKEVVERIKIYPKVKMTRNYKNMGMLTNKMLAVKKSSSDWVILFDSDNILTDSYVRNIPDNLSPDTIYMPEFAEPQFDYTKFAGMTFDKNNISELASDPMGNCALNTCNYVVHRNTYLKTFELNTEMKETDTLYFNYLHLKKGGKFHIVPNMRYFHRFHEGSGWLRNQDYNLKKAEELTEMIKSL